MTTPHCSPVRSLGILSLLASVSFLFVAPAHAEKATVEADSAATSSPGASAYAHERPVQISDLEGEELVSATFDASVYSGTRNGYPDLRLLNDEGGLVPHRIRRKETMQERVDRKTWSTKSLHAQPLDSGGLEIHITLENDAPPVDGVRILTPLRDFEHRVTIATSDDGIDWEPVIDEALIFDYSKYLDVRRDEIPLPTTLRRHLMIVIDSVTSRQESELMELTRQLRGNGDATEEASRTERLVIDRRPFRIDRIELWSNHVRTLASGPIDVSYQPLSHQVEEDVKSGRTVVVIDSQREPLTSLTLQTSTKNFSRRVWIEVEETHGNQVEWRQIASAILSRVDFKTMHSESITIPFPETRSARLRLVIENRDSPPLAVTGVEAAGPQYEVLFLAVPNISYRLTYGAPTATHADLDTAAIDTLIANGFTPKLATLGAVTTGTLPTPPTNWTDIFSNVPLMTGVILLLVVALGWGLMQAMKRVDQMP